MPELIHEQFSSHFPWEISAEEMEVLHKAMTAGDGTNAASFTNGRALIYESLEKLLSDMTLSEQRAAFWRMIPKRDIRAIIHMWNEQTSFGTEWESASTEVAAPSVQDVDIARKYAEVAHYRDTRQRSDMIMHAATTIDPEKQLEAMGGRRIVHNIVEVMSINPAVVHDRRASP